MDVLQTGSPQSLLTDGQVWWVVSNFKRLTIESNLINLCKHVTNKEKMNHVDFKERWQSLSLNHHDYWLKSSFMWMLCFAKYLSHKPMFHGIDVAPAKAKHDRRTHNRQTDPYEALCFAGTIKIVDICLASYPMTIGLLTQCAFCWFLASRDECPGS